MNEARSLMYSISVEANTAQAEHNIRNITSSLGSLQNSAGKINIETNTTQAEHNIRNITSSIGSLEALVQLFVLLSLKVLIVEILFHHH